MRKFFYRNSILIFFADIILVSLAWYLSYLLRLWVVQNQEGCLWRCSVEDVQTGERYGFANLELLISFLQEQTVGQSIFG